MKKEKYTSLWLRFVAIAQPYFFPRIPGSGKLTLLLMIMLLLALFGLLFFTVAALITGFMGGAVVQLFDDADRAKETPESTPPTCSDSCCEGNRSQSGFRRILRYGFVTLPRDIGLALLLGAG